MDDQEDMARSTAGPPAAAGRQASDLPPTAAGATLTLKKGAVMANQAFLPSPVPPNEPHGTGGGIYNAGTLIVEGGEVAMNTSYYGGGGIYSTETGTVTVRKFDRAGNGTITVRKGKGTDPGALTVTGCKVARGEFEGEIARFSKKQVIHA